MAERRRPDTSKMFLSMRAPAEDSVNSPELTDHGAESTVQPAFTPPPTKKERKKRKPRVDDPMDRQSVKLGFYLTPRVYEAMQLHKTVNFIGVHNDSQIVNKALSDYLKKELEALKNEDESLPTEERLRAASKKIMGN